MKATLFKHMHCSTKEKDIFDTFTKDFEERKIDIPKTFAPTIDGPHVIVGQHRG